MLTTSRCLLFCLVLLAPALCAAVELGYTRVSERGSIVDIRHAGDGSGRLFLVEQAGRIWILQEGTELAEPFLDISDRISAGGERGLLSLAFAPDYESSGAFYTWYTDGGGDTTLARFRVSSDPDRADPTSEETVLLVEQPRGNHNGGQLQFGADGYLYLGIGDGGGAGDPDLAGQDLDTLLGKLVRLDVDPVHGTYAVPADNPLVGLPGRDEIWAWGLRNPWRMAFDPLTQDLFIADVGQNDYEEINVQGLLEGGGQNYGWNLMEGTACFTAGCDTEGLVLPVGGYAHDEGCSVTGGVVYRGTAYPELHGRYLFGDYCTGTIWGLKRASGAWEQVELDRSPYSILTFGVGEDRSLYLSAGGQGVFRVTDGPLAVEPPFRINAGLSDAWFEEATTGQGLFIAVFTELGVLSLAWFTYDLERPPPEATAVLGEPGHRWFTAVGPFDGTGANLEVFLTEGGRFDSSTPPATDAPVGTLRLDFAHCNSGVLTYRFDDGGPEGQIPLKRVANDNIALCEALSAD